MELKIAPEPDPAELQAIEAALADRAESAEASRGEWWRRGVYENVDDEET